MNQALYAHMNNKRKMEKEKNNNKIKKTKTNKQTKKKQIKVSSKVRSFMPAILATQAWAKITKPGVVVHACGISYVRKNC
jgi:hypothetical protein